MYCSIIWKSDVNCTRPHADDIWSAAANRVFTFGGGGGGGALINFCRRRRRVIFSGGGGAARRGASLIIKQNARNIL